MLLFHNNVFRLNQNDLAVSSLICIFITKISIQAFHIIPINLPPSPPDYSIVESTQIGVIDNPTNLTVGYSSSTMSFNWAEV